MSVFDPVAVRQNHGSNYTGNLRRKP
jgi:hypothetical protein